LRNAAEAWLAAIPRRVGYHGHFRSVLLPQIIDEPQKRKVADPNIAQIVVGTWQRRAEPARRLQLQFASRR
jgi:hypothetical protein